MFGGSAYPLKRRLEALPARVGEVSPKLLQFREVVLYAGRLKASGTVIAEQDTQRFFRRRIIVKHVRYTEQGAPCGR